MSVQNVSWYSGVTSGGQIVAETREDERARPPAGVSAPSGKPSRSEP